MTKIRIRVGEVEVEYEGGEAFLNKKLPDLVKQLSGLAEPVRGAKGSSGGGAGRANRGGDPGTLAAFLRDKKAVKSQVRKFLATAQWLHLGGTKPLRTHDVTKALSDNYQGALGNPAQSLNHNATKGHCERVTGGFCVTDEGRSSLG